MLVTVAKVKPVFICTITIVTGALSSSLTAFGDQYVGALGAIATGLFVFAWLLWPYSVALKCSSISGLGSFYNSTLHATFLLSVVLYVAAVWVFFDGGDLNSISVWLLFSFLLFWAFVATVINASDLDRGGRLGVFTLFIALYFLPIGAFYIRNKIPDTV